AVEIRQAWRPGILGVRLLLRLLVGAALALPPALVLTHSAQAAGVVTDCANYGSPTGLGAALAAGGSITFNCTGAGPFTAVFPAQFDLTSNVSIDGSDQGRNDVTLSGGNLIRLFGVHVATTLTLANLTVSNGQATKVSADGSNAGAIANLGGTLIITN